MATPVLNQPSKQIPGQVNPASGASQGLPAYTDPAVLAQAFQGPQPQMDMRGLTPEQMQMLMQQEAQAKELSLNIMNNLFSGATKGSNAYTARQEAQATPQRLETEQKKREADLELAQAQKNLAEQEWQLRQFAEQQKMKEPILVANASGETMLVSKKAVPEGFAPIETMMDAADYKKTIQELNEKTMIVMPGTNRVDYVDPGEDIPTGWALASKVQPQMDIGGTARGAREAAQDRTRDLLASPNEFVTDYIANKGGELATKMGGTMGYDPDDPLVKEAQKAWSEEVMDTLYNDRAVVRSLILNPDNTVTTKDLGQPSVTIPLNSLPMALQDRLQGSSPGAYTIRQQGERQDIQRESSYPILGRSD